MRRSPIRRRHKNAPRPEWKTARSYLQWLRGCECALADRGGCKGKIEAAHTPDPNSKGMSTKAADCNAVPMCSHHHREHTNKGWSAIGLTRESAMKLADRYWRAWPGRVEWERNVANG